MLTVEFKLVDVPEMNYTSKDVDEKGEPSPRGEIWVRGPGVIPGYYMNDEKNKETFTDDGWVVSGDIGQLVGKERRMYIIDRKKNIFKLQQGEYIAPEKLENAYKNAHLSFGNIFVYGKSTEDHLVAIMNIESEPLMRLGKEIGLNLPPSELAKS